MSIFTSLFVSWSGLNAQQTRMDTIADNIANVNTLQTPQGGPYQRESVIFQPWAAAQGVTPPTPPTPEVNGQWATNQPLPIGVQAASIATDTTQGRLVYEPSNPLADSGGYVRYPNVNLVTEVSDMMGATRAYQANVTAVNAAKSMATTALSIGKGA